MQVKQKKRNMWTMILKFIGGAMVAALIGVAIFLVLESRFDVIDQTWLSNMVIPTIMERHYREFDSKIGPIYTFYTRTAEDEAQLICDKLNIQITYYGLERIPKDMPFIMVANEHTILDGCFLVQAINYVRADEEAKLLRIKQWPQDNNNTYSLPVVIYGNNGNKLMPNGAEVVTQHLTDGYPLVIFGSGKYDVRLFDKDEHFRFKSGFLRFARDAKVGILPVYVDIDFPLTSKVINSLWPRFGDTYIHYKTIEFMRNQHIKITIGNFIPFEEIPESDLASDKTKSLKVLKKYENLVFDLKSNDKLRDESTQVNFAENGWED